MLFGRWGCENGSRSPLTTKLIKQMKHYIKSDDNGNTIINEAEFAAQFAGAENIGDTWYAANDDEARLVKAWTVKAYAVDGNISKRCSSAKAAAKYVVDMGWMDADGGVSEGGYNRFGCVIVSTCGFLKMEIGRHKLKALTA